MILMSCGTQLFCREKSELMSQRMVLHPIPHGHLHSNAVKTNNDNVMRLQDYRMLPTQS